MKKIGALIFLFLSIHSFSQETIRRNIKGKIIVEGNDLEGITIFNSSTKKGAVSNEIGEFDLLVGENDSIKVRALEYQDFDFTINSDILTSRKVTIFLLEEINKLDEIIVSTRKLTGNFQTDVEITNRFTEKKDVIYFGAKRNAELTTIKNVEVDKMHYPKQTLVDGLNIVNVVDQLLIPLFRSEVKNKKEAGIPEVPVKAIKYYLASNFLINNFNIPEHRVEEFVRFVEDDTFDFKLLNYGNEIELLEILNQKSKTFLKKNKE